MLKIDLKKLPLSPGVYIFKKDDIILYVGKAKEIRKRVKSYFYSNDPKARDIIKNSNSLTYIITNSELEAQILESKLIYQQKPFYNIQYKYRNPLKYIAIINKDGFPYFYKTDSFLPYAEEIFGPSINNVNHEQIFRLLGKLFGVRQCKYDFRKHKPKLCIYYHLNMCSAPCQEMVSKEKYLENFNKAVDFLKLKQNLISNLIQEYQTKIKELSERLEFEKAIIYRDKLTILNKYVEKFLNSHSQTYLYLIIDEVSFIGILFPPSSLKILELHNIGDLSPSQILFNTILNLNSKKVYVQEKYLSQLLDLINFYQNYSSNNPENFDEILSKINKLEIEFKNDENYQYLEKICLQKLDYYKQNNVFLILNKLSKILHIESITRIESIDISHLHGKNVYGALVVFENTKFNKSKYRIFKLNSSFDDLSNIYELLSRRFSHQEWLLPQLIIIDGGINQLSYAVKAFYDWLNSNPNNRKYSNIKFISISKPEDKIYFYNKNSIQLLNLDENIWNFIRRIRDETHRFANSRRIKFSKVIS